MKSTQKAGPVPGDGIPEVFQVAALDHDSAVRAALEILSRAGVPTGGYDAVARELKPVAWRAHLHGGGASDDRQRLAQAQHHLSQAVGRRGGLKAKRLSAGEVEGEIAVLERNVSRLQAQVNAAGDAHLRDQKSRRVAADRAARARDQALGQLAPYRTAHLPAPPALEEAIAGAERAARDTEADFESGAAELHRLSREADRLATRARGALAACLVRLAGRLGSEAKAMLKGQDADLLRRFPHRAEEVLGGLVRQVDELDAIACRLTGEAGGCSDGFRNALGETGETILDAMLGLGGRVTDYALNRRKVSA